MAEDKKLTKVVFHYSDDTSKFIDGDELDRWNGFNRQIAIFATIHNQNPDWSAVKWQWVTNTSATTEDTEAEIQVKTAND